MPSRVPLRELQASALVGCFRFLRQGAVGVQDSGAWGLGGGAWKSGLRLGFGGVGLLRSIVYAVQGSWSLRVWGTPFA